MQCETLSLVLDKLVCRCRKNGPRSCFFFFCLSPFSLFLYVCHSLFVLLSLSNDVVWAVDETEPMDAMAVGDG